MSDPDKSNPFSGPQIQGVHYARADMTASNFDGVNLADSRFFAVLTKAKFTDTNLQAADFDDVNLSQTTFNNITLSGATIQNANLSGMRISAATMENTDIKDVNLTGMRINGVLVSDLFDAYEKAQG